MKPRQFCALTFALAFACSAGADTAYVKPSTFEPRINQIITLEVAFSDLCCEPRHSVQNASYAVIAPDGLQKPPDRIETFSTMSVLEHTIRHEGTTRFTTGERLGRKGEYVLLEGTYYLVNSPDADPWPIPAGTAILTSQTATVSDAYVTVGSPSWDTVRMPIGRLVIEPRTHPNEVREGSKFAARVTFDGVPVAHQNVIVTSEAQRLRREGHVKTKTDEDGVFRVVLCDPGVTLLMVRLQRPAPEGAETDIRSYTTSVIIDVSDN